MTFREAWRQFKGMDATSAKQQYVDTLIGCVIQVSKMNVFVFCVVYYFTIWHVRVFFGLGFHIRLPHVEFSYPVFDSTT
jgi:hypothetical protein